MLTVDDIIFDYDLIDPKSAEAPVGAIFEVFRVDDGEVVGYADTSDGALELIAELERS